MSKSQTETTSRFHNSLAGIMALVAVAAVIARWWEWSYLSISAIAYFTAYRIVRGPRGWARFLTLLGAIYAPCVLGFWTDCDHCRETWIKLFPIAPTVAPTLFIVQLLGFGRLPDHAEFGLSAVTLCILLATLATIGRRGRARLIGSALFGLAWSCLWAWVFHALLRS
jgi:hypothetical protein